MKKTHNIIIVFLGLFYILSSCSSDDNIVDVTTISTETTEQQKVFQEFWDIYDRYYPLMHRKNINWQSIYDANYPQITTTTTDTQLLGIFQTIMGTVIKDGHSGLTFNSSQEVGFEPEFNENIENMIQNNTPDKVNIIASSANNSYISYGTLISNPDIGYINSKNFEPVNENDSEFNNFKTVVDEALIALQNKSGIIIDIRTNGGGQGQFAFYLAGRFFSDPTPIQLVRQRTKDTKGSTASSLSDWVTTNFDGYSEPRVEGGLVAAIEVERHEVAQSGIFQYTNKVALLTSKGSASAAEYFTAAMKTQTHVKSLGDTTFGIFAGSDTFTLTNGSGKWKTTVSIHDVELLYNNTFQSFEGIGISPDEISIPTEAEVSAGSDVHITAAINYIVN